MKNNVTPPYRAKVADQPGSISPVRLSTKKHGAQNQRGPKRQAAAGSKANKAAPKKAVSARKQTTKPTVPKALPPRPERKGGRILDLIGRSEGATLAELMKVTGWQAHSVRGFISIAAKKQSVKIESMKNKAGDRVYQFAK